jgi:asparagine synthase (glutamine-hydrolysing)
MAGVYADGPIVLAHRRLSILDTSEAGRQPMASADSSIQVVFNGEIYNYRELRNDLTGYRWESDSDTEVLLHLYEEYGRDCLSKLRGMFAFAIWDADRERLLLARDRLGQKPLFYRHTDEGVWFGSTVGTILADDAVQPTPDLSAIRSYLTYQYVPAPRTGFETIRQLEPGTALTVDIDGGTTTERYWSLSFTEQETVSPDRLIEQLRDKLREATRLRTRSDVPLGAFLSGGIDSSVVVAMLSEVSNEPINTYAIGFDIDRYDELEYARLVADEFGTNHTEYTVDTDTMLESVTDLVDHYGMPFGDTSALPTYYVSKLAAGDITVALTGDAGDENFAGYDRYGIDRTLGRLGRLPNPVLTLGYAALDAVPAPYRSKKTLRWPRKAFEYAMADPDTRYGLIRCHAHSDEIDDFWAGPVPEDEFANIRAALAAADGPTRLDHLLQTDITTYLPDDILVKVDRASMAHSLEVRSPFLDHEVVEYAARIPARYKRRDGVGKWVLKEAFQDLLPTMILERDKHGFGVPVDEWFRGGLEGLASSHLDRLGDREPFTASQLDRLLDEHRREYANNGDQLWDLVMLEEWYERYID